MDKEKYEKKLWDLAMLQNMIDEHVGVKENEKQ